MKGINKAVCGTKRSLPLPFCVTYWNIRSSASYALLAVITNQPTPYTRHSFMDYLIVPQKPAVLPR